MSFSITPDQVKAIAAVIDDGSFEEETFRTDYSGRGMYGRTCFGYVGNNPGAISLELAAIIARQMDPEMDESEVSFTYVMEGLREALYELGSPSRDSMGMSMIYYWPNVSVETESAAVTG